MLDVFEVRIDASHRGEFRGDRIAKVQPGICRNFVLLYFEHPIGEELGPLSFGLRKFDAFPDAIEFDLFGRPCVAP